MVYFAVHQPSRRLGTFGFDVEISITENRNDNYIIKCTVHGRPINVASKHLQPDNIIYNMTYTNLQESKRAQADMVQQFRVSAISGLLAKRRPITENSEENTI